MRALGRSCLRGSCSACPRRAFISHQLMSKDYASISASGLSTHQEPGSIEVLDRSGVGSRHRKGRQVFKSRMSGRGRAGPEQHADARIEDNPRGQRLRPHSASTGGLLSLCSLGAGAARTDVTVCLGLPSPKDRGSLPVGGVSMGGASWQAQAPRAMGGNPYSVPLGQTMPSRERREGFIDVFTCEDVGDGSLLALKCSREGVVNKRHRCAFRN